MTVGANQITLLNLVKQALVRTTMTDKVRYGFALVAPFTMIEFHDPRMEQSSTILTRTLFGNQQDISQPCALPVLVATVLFDET